MTITTKSFLSQIVKSAMLCLVCAAVAAAQQSETRLLKKELVPPIEPVPLELSNLQVNGSPIKFDQPFSAGNEWLKGLSFDIKNVSGKVVTHLKIGLRLENPVNNQSPEVTMFFHGRDTMLPNIEPTLRFAPGEAMHVVYTDKSYESFKRMCDFLKLDKVTEAMLSIEMVVFDDETMWRAGNLFRRDPSNPMRWKVVRFDLPWDRKPKQ